MMISKSCDEYISNREWLRAVIGGKNLILCGVSALEYLELFDGYIGEIEINVYSLAKGKYDNINYHIVDSFEKIDYIKHGNVLCSSLNQTINDMLRDKNCDEQALSEALSNYYFSHGESFDELHISFQNAERFNDIKEHAINYYSGG